MAFTTEKYQELVAMRDRIQTYRNIQIKFNKTLLDIKSNMSECLKEYQKISGSPASDIDQDTIDEMAAIYQKFNAAVNNIESNHAVFLRGQAAKVEE